MTTCMDWMTTSTIPYDANGVVKLVIIDPGGDGDWVDTSFTMTLRASANGVSPSPAAVKVTITDGDPQPTVSFSSTSIALTEGTQTDGQPCVHQVGRWQNRYDGRSCWHE